MFFTLLKIINETSFRDSLRDVRDSLSNLFYDDREADVRVRKKARRVDREETILVDMAQQFLDHHGFDGPEHNDLYGTSPVHRAVTNKIDPGNSHLMDKSSPTRFFSDKVKRAQLVRYILKNGGTRQLMSKDTSGWTPLHHALRCEILVRVLIEHGANVNATDYVGQTALHLVSKDELGTVPREERTDDLEVIQMLLDHGADLEARDFEGWTPLLRACREGNTPVVKFLAEKGANVHCRASEGRTPLHLLLQAHRGGPRKRSDIVDIVELCKRAGADVNAQDKYGFTPLHQATLKGRGDIVLLLMQHGADASLKTNDHQMTALHLASHHDQFETFQVLLEYTSDLSAVTFSGNTVLHLANTAPLAQCILENTTHHSAKDRAQLLHIKNQEGQTPLNVVKQRLQEDGAEADMIRYSQLQEYLESYTEASLAIPNDVMDDNQRDDGVKLNENLNEFQQIFARKTHKLIDQTDVHECAYIIMGYLSPADVMKQ